MLVLLHPASPNDPGDVNPRPARPHPYAEVVSHHADELARYHQHIRRYADVLVTILRNGPPTAAVPACPGWTLLNLVDHLGRVHQWATEIVLTGTGPHHETTGLEHDNDPVTWYRARVERLLSALTDTDPTRACWTLAPHHRTAAFWSRRQAHELAMHQIDAAQAIEQPASYDAALAVDGLDEVLDVMAPRVARRTGISVEPRAALMLRCTDRPQRWVLRPPLAPTRSDPDRTTTPPLVTAGALDWEIVPSDHPDPEVAATIEAPAETLLLTLWNRPVPEQPRVSGDRTVADTFLGNQLTP